MVNHEQTIFVVHGRTESKRLLVENFLSETLDPSVRPVVLMDQVNRSQAVIEKFRRNMESAVYAVVLLTPDDVGGLAAALSANADGMVPHSLLRERARQNVIFELGYVLALLPGPVAVLDE